MKQIESYESFAAKTAAFFGRGMATNCFLSRDILEREIAAGNLYFSETEGCLLLFRKRQTHWQMYFYLADGVPTLPQLPCVTEIACRARDTALLEAVNRLKNAGLQCLCTRHRRKHPAVEVQDSTAVFAQARDLEAAFALLQASFSPLTGCLPTQEELLRDIQNRELLLLKKDDQIAGLLHFQNTKPALEIRHLATDAAFRGQGVASALLQSLFTLPDVRAFRVWVVDGNTAAERLYEKHGFGKDGFFSHVLGYMTEKDD